jgi:hypothetical protein
MNMTIKKITKAQLKSASQESSEIISVWMKKNRLNAELSQDNSSRTNEVKNDSRIMGKVRGY